MDETTLEDGNNSAVEEAKMQMLAWDNPVEFVNNMYGCHPGDGDSKYFQVVFGAPPKE